MRILLAESRMDLTNAYMSVGEAVANGALHGVQRKHGSTEWSFARSAKKAQE